MVIIEDKLYRSWQSPGSYVIKTMTSALIGSRTVKQLEECLDSLKNLKFSKFELKQIDKFAKEEKINLWEPSSRY